MLRNGRILLPAHQTLAERLTERGYHTAGFVSSYVLADRFGLGQGFQLWDDEFEPATATSSKEGWHAEGVDAVDRRGDATTGRALSEHGRDETRPFFLFVHYFDPHSPYAPPPEFVRRFPPAGGPGSRLRSLVARYDAEIAFTDAQIGVLLAGLDRLGLADEDLERLRALGYVK